MDAALVGGGNVTFNCGGPATITVTSTKTIATNTTIDGGGIITISGGDSSAGDSVRVFAVDVAAKFTVNHVTIANGGILNNGGALSLANSTFTNNVADGSRNGGGILNNAGAATVTDSTFTANFAWTAGGGIANQGGGPLTVINCAFTGNGAGEGGGIANQGGGTLTVGNSTFTDNGARDGGGGIFNYTGTLMVTSSTFTGNRASSAGGGIAISGGSVSTVSNSTFAGNVADLAGGGILNSLGSLTVTNCTLTGNSTNDSAHRGGISNSGTPHPSLRNTILAGNGNNCSGTITDGGHNLDDGISCGFSSAQGSLSSTDPQFDPTGLQDNGGPTQTIALLPTSPAIGAGDQDVCAATPVNDRDQRGFGRPGNGNTNCSIGAYEAHATPSGLCIGDCGGNGEVTVDELITLVNIDLGTASLSACPNGIPTGTEVDVALIIAAVDNSLGSCPPPEP